MDQEVVQSLFSAFIVVATMLLVGFPVHEALHAWTAMKLGDMSLVSMPPGDPPFHYGQRENAEALLAGAEPMAGDLGEQWLDLLAAYAKFLIARSDPGAGAAVARALTAHEELLGPSHPSVIALREIAQGS